MADEVKHTLPNAFPGDLIRVGRAAAFYEKPKPVAFYQKLEQEWDEDFILYPDGSTKELSRSPQMVGKYSLNQTIRQPYGILVASLSNAPGLIGGSTWSRQRLSDGASLALRM